MENSHRIGGGRKVDFSYVCRYYLQQRAQMEIRHLPPSHIDRERCQESTGPSSQILISRTEQLKQHNVGMALNQLAKVSSSPAGILVNQTVQTYIND